MNKITVVGDIVCDKEMLKHAKYRGKYNFDNMFKSLEGYFKDSDYVIANLETVISNLGYTNSVFSFNNPESLLSSLSKIGINAVSLANNHILDRGLAGLEETINNLNKYKIDYFGVNNKKLCINLEDCNVCVLGYTDSTNYHVNKCELEEKVNMLKPQKLVIKRNYKNLFEKLYYKLNPNIRININNFLRIKIKPIVDKSTCYDELDKYMNHLEEDIKDSYNGGYYTILYPHMGGQFNICPGTYTLKMVEKFIKYGVDSVVITHPHIVQKMTTINNRLCFYSIGGMIISPDSKFVIWETRPEYSVVLHYYFDNMKLIKITCSFLICVRDKNSYLKVNPFYDYYKKLSKEERVKVLDEFTEVYNRVFNCNLKKVKVSKEYLIREEV